MKKLSKKEREARIIARGEFSDHSHVVTGNVTVRNENGEILIDVHEDSDVFIKHVIESFWLNGTEEWTKEHNDIPLAKGTYKYIPQLEFHPYENEIQRVKD